MQEPTADELQRAFASHGVEAPPEYLWLVKHRTLGFDAFTQMEPWQFCGVAEVCPISKQWPTAGIKRELIPFARLQSSDDLACFEFASGQVIRICEIHYNLGSPVYVEFCDEYSTLWEWLHGAIDHMKFWYELQLERPPGKTGRDYTEKEGK